MTPELALGLGKAVAFVAGRGRAHVPRILIGKDTRLSGYMLEHAIAAGHLLDGRARPPVRAHPDARPSRTSPSACAPTPGSSSAPATTRTRTTASRSSARDGFKLPDATEAEIEELMREPELLGERADRARGIGKASKLDDARGRYVVFAKATFPRGLTLDGVRIVVDAAHGAAYKVAPLVFSELGAKVTRSA